MKHNYYNPPDRRRKKKVSYRSVASKIASSMLATITAATTIASPVLTYAADVNGTDTVTETTADTNQGETKTIVSTDAGNTNESEAEKKEETRFLFVNLKNTGGQVILDKDEDNEQTVKLAKHKSDDGKTDEMRIDVYDKNDVLVSSEDAAKNNYTYAYEVKADSVTNVKADADDGYILKLYDVVENNTKKDSGFDEKTDGQAGEFEYPAFIDANVTVKVEFEKEETKEDGKTADDISVDTNDTKEADKDAKESAGKNGSEKDTSGDLTVNDDAEAADEKSETDSTNAGDADEKTEEDTADTADSDNTEEAGGTETPETKDDLSVNDTDTKENAADAEGTDSKASDESSDVKDKSDSVSDETTEETKDETDGENPADISDEENGQETAADSSEGESDASVSDNTDEKDIPDEADSTVSSDSEDAIEVSDGNDDKENTGTESTDSDTGEADTPEEDVNDTEDEETVSEDVETVDISSLNEDDFSSARLIVISEDKDSIIDQEKIIGSYDNIYLVQYDTAKQAMEAYVHYANSGITVEPDAKITAAESSDTADVTTNTDKQNEDSNAIAVLNGDDSSSEAVQYSKVIALIDTGASENKNIIGRVSLIDDILNGGTHGDDMVKDIVSQNNDAKILSIRALGNDGYGSYSAVISGIEYAINSKVDIINLSMYSPKTLATSVIETEIQKAVDKGIVVVGAAGNDGKNVSEYIPGSIQDVYTIGAATVDGIRITSSNYGELVDYYAVADSTSEAAAKFSGYISKNGIEAVSKDKSGLFFETVNNSSSDIDVVDKDVDTAKEDDTIYDPVIEKYVKEHADPNYVGKGQLSMVNVMDVDATIAAAEDLNEGETIDSLMAGDDFRFITQQTGRVPVYQLNEGSNYFVAFADVMHNDKRASMVDYQIALNDTTGSPIKGTHFDKNTGLLYIPRKAYFGTDGKYYIQRIQTQILYSIQNFDINNSWNSSVIATTEETNGDTESKISGADILDQRMSVQVGKNMDVNTMLVIANGFPVDGKYYAYDSKTGVLTLGFSSAVVQSVWVQAEKSADAPDVEPGMKAASQTLDDMWPVVDQVIGANFSNLSRGYDFTSSIKMYYPDKAGWDDWAGIEEGNVLPAYRGQPGGSEYYEQTMLDFIFYGNKSDSDFIPDGVVYQPVSGSIYPFVVRVDTISCADIAFKELPADSKMAMECTHIDMPGFSDSVPTSDWYTARIRGRVVKVNKGNNPYAILAIYTSQCANQHGFGLFKVRIRDQRAGIKVIKKSSDSKTAGNSYYTLQGAKYTIKHGSDLIATLTTNANGVASTSANALPFGMYTIQETAASRGYKIDSTRYTVKINKTNIGQIIPVNSTETPSTGIIKLQKKTADTKVNGNSNYSLAGAIYGVYSDAACTKQVTAMTTDANGNASTGKMYAGTYYVREKAPSKGYKIENYAHKVTLNDDVGYTKTVVSTETPTPIIIHLQKKSSDSKTSGNSNYSLAGATYGVYSDSACSKQVATMTTNSSGKASTSGYKLYAGTYYVREKSPSKGYNSENYTHKVTVNKDNNYTATVTSTEPVKKGGLTVRKQAAYEALRNYMRAHKTGHSYSLAGAVYKVYSDSACKHLVLTLPKTDANGKTKTSDTALFAGNYWIKESSPSSGFNVNTTPIQCKVTAGQAASQNVYVSNEPKKPAYLNIKKMVDLYSLIYAKNSNYGTISDCRFTLYDDKACTKVSKSLEGNNYIIPINAGNSQKATRQVEVIAGHTYYLKETTCVKGTPENDFVFGPIVIQAGQTKTVGDFIKKNSSGKSVDANGKVMVSTWVNSSGYFINRPYRYYGKIVKKISSDKKTGLENAVFRVRYREQKDGEIKRVWYLASDKNGLVAVDDGYLVDNKGITSAYKHRSSGMFYQTDTSTGKKTYFLPLGWLEITEVEAPNGYKLNNTVKVIQIKPAANATSLTSDRPWEATLSDTNYTLSDPVIQTVWRATVKVKKVDKDKKPLAGAVFGIYKSEADAKNGNNPIIWLTTGSNGLTPNYTTKAMEQSDASTYTLYCKELVAPEGYALPKNAAPLSLTFKTSDFNKLSKSVQDTTGEIKQFGGSQGIVNDKAGWPYSMQVRKVDQNGNGLAGAEFSVYRTLSDAQAWDNEIFTFKTGANGYTGVKTMRLTDDVTSQTLYCRETKAPDGYRMNYQISQLTWKKENAGTSEQGQVMLFGGKEGVVDESANLWHMNMFIKKVNEKGEALAGAEFTVYDDEDTANANVIGVLKTDATGVSNTLACSTEQDEVTYYCKETKAPAGYKPTDEVFPLTFTKSKDKNATKQFGPVDGVINSNDWFLQMKVRKTDEKGNSLAGAEFGVYTEEDCNDDSQITTLASGTNGWSNVYKMKVSEEKESVTLYCKEISAPDGYEISQEVLSATWNKADATSSGEEKSFGTLVNTKIWTAAMKLKKIDDNENALEGAVFGIYTDEGCAEETEIGEITSGEDGWTDVFEYTLTDDVDQITLFCKELEAPAGYMLSDTVYSSTWEKAEDGTVKTFGDTTSGEYKGIVNKAVWKLRLNAKKIDENGNGLAGAVFSIYTDKNCEEESLVGNITSSEDGATEDWTYDNIPASKTSIDLFLKETETPEGYTPDEEVHQLTWTKADYDAQAADGNTDGELKSFGDIVNKSIWTIKYFVKKVDEEQNALADVKFKIYSDKDCTPDSYVCTLTTDESGTTEVYEQEIEGTKDSVTLWCKEVEVPDGYEMSAEKYPLAFDRDTNDGEAKMFGPEGGIVNKKMQPPKIKIKKKSTASEDILGLSGYQLSGATFTITDGNGFEEELTTDENGETEELELPYTAHYDYGDGTEDPKLVPVTTEYTITETAAPAGHLLDSTPQKISVTCPDDGGETKLIEFSDEPVFVHDSFQITKISTKNTPVADVVFKVEFLDGDESKNAVRTWYLVSDKDGLVKMDASYLSKDAKYESDAFFKYKGKNVIPIGGGLRITEVQAPGEYEIDPMPAYIGTDEDSQLKLVIKNDLKPSKITLKKYDSDGKTPLPGVEFELKFLEEAETSANITAEYTRLLKVGESTTGITDEDGTITFENLDQGKYQITEIKTTSGHTLLKDPITVTLPITMTDEDAKANNADTSKAVWDETTGKWMFFECTYEISNTAVFKLPMTGGSGWKYGIIGIVTLATLGAGLILVEPQKKKKVHRRRK